MNMVDDAIERICQALAGMPERSIPDLEQYPGSIEAGLMASGRATAECVDKAVQMWGYGLPMPELTDEQYWWFRRRLSWAMQFLHALRAAVEPHRIADSTESLLVRTLVSAWSADGLQQKVQDAVFLLLRGHVPFLTTEAGRTLIKELEVFLEPEVHYRF
jgi:hypothetical protein